MASARRTASNGKGYETLVNGNWVPEGYTAPNQDTYAKYLYEQKLAASGLTAADGQEDFLDVGNGQLWNPTTGEFTISQDGQELFRYKKGDKDPRLSMGMTQEDLDAVDAQFKTSNDRINELLAASNLTDDSSEREIQDYLKKADFRAFGEYMQSKDPETAYQRALDNQVKQRMTASGQLEGDYFQQFNDFWGGLEVDQTQEEFNQSHLQKWQDQQVAAKNPVPAPVAAPTPPPQTPEEANANLSSEYLTQHEIDATASADEELRLRGEQGLKWVSGKGWVKDTQQPVSEAPTPTQEPTAPSQPAPAMETGLLSGKGVQSSDNDMGSADYKPGEMPSINKEQSNRQNGAIFKLSGGNNTSEGTNTSFSMPNVEQSPMQQGKQGGKTSASGQAPKQQIQTGSYGGK